MTRGVRAATALDIPDDKGQVLGKGQGAYHKDEIMQPIREHMSPRDSGYYLASLGQGALSAVQSERQINAASTPVPTTCGDYQMKLLLFD